MVSLKWGLGVGSLWFLEEIRITELRGAAGPPLWGLVSSNPLRARVKHKAGRRAKSLSLLRAEPFTFPCPGNLVLLVLRFSDLG